MNVHRKRRIASDEAHAWARNLRLGNAHAKYVLCMLTLYVNGDGACFVSIPQLADDCELAANTIRRRLAWLEQIGAVMRRAQWIDDVGRRNSEGRGRRTTDDILLLIDADPEAIERQAKGQPESEQAENIYNLDPPSVVVPPATCNNVDPPSVVVPPATCNNVDPSLALQLRGGPESSEPEEEEESPPNPPHGGGGRVIDEDFERDLAEAQRLYPAPITNVPRFRSALATFNAPKRQRVLTAMRGYAAFIAECERKKKPRAVKDADRWLASGMWQGYVVSGKRSESRAARKLIGVESAEGRAWALLHEIAGFSEPLRGRDGYLLLRPLDARMLAFANAPLKQNWHFVAETDVNHVGAWREFLGDALGKQLGFLIRDRVWRGTERMPLRGFLVPWPWPPRKDGSIAATGPPETLMTEDDIRELANFR